MDWARLPSISALRAFEATARLKSFSAAARELNVTHAAVSQQVRGLERDLGAQLVEREGRGLRILPDGAELAHALNLGFQTIANGVEVLSAATASRPLNVTMTPNFASHWFMPRFGGFLADHPEADIVINPTGAMVDLQGGQCDIAIRYGDGNWPGLEAELLVPARHVVVGAPSLVGHNLPAEASGLACFRWLEEEGSDEVMRWLRAEGLADTARGPITSMPGNLILPALLDGYGIGAMTLEFAQQHLDSGALVKLWDAGHSDKGYFIATRRGPRRPAAAEFILWLRRCKKKGRAIARPKSNREVKTHQRLRE